MTVQAQHDSEAGDLVHALRAAACTPLLTLTPSSRTPHQLVALSQLTRTLQVCSQLEVSFCITVEHAVCGVCFLFSHAC